MEKRSYGLLIETRHRHGLQRVNAFMIVREGESESPINPRSDGESTIYDAPKHLDGLMLNGFGMSGFVSDLDGAPFIGYEPEFRELFAIDWRQVKRMDATFKRVYRQFAKDEPREPGDMLVSLARALRLDFTVWRIGDGPERSSYSDDVWNWRTINEGRDRYRALIAKAREEALAKKAA